MQKITPFLWFDDQAEEAANYYVAAFKEAGAGDSEVTTVSKYTEEGGKAAGKPAGSTMIVVFKLNGQDIMAVNGGPQFKFTPAISLMVNCDTQEEIDALWEKLSEGGEPGQCGWLTDRYDVPWQIIPTALGEFMQSDPEGSKRAMSAMLRMNKIEIEVLKRAYESDS